MNSSERILGIDIIRIVSMLMILVLHICLQGGILDALTVGSAAYGAAWLLESFCYCAVNCYALITGYVMYSAERKNFKYSRIIPLWLQVFVWSVLIVILFKVFGHAELTVKDVISAVFPILNSRYWYFTAYFGMFFLIPFFNILIDNIDKKGYICLIATLFFRIFVPSLRHHGRPFHYKIRIQYALADCALFCGGFYKADGAGNNGEKTGMDCDIHTVFGNTVYFFDAAAAHHRRIRRYRRKHIRLQLAFYRCICRFSVYAFERYTDKEPFCDPCC